MCINNRLSHWERKIHDRHPLLVPFCISLSFFILGWLGNMYIPAKPVFEILPKPSTKSAKISVTNKGLIPASGTYKIMSQDSAIVPETIEGDQYSDLKPTKDNGVWLLKYTNLPHNKKIKTNIIGSDVVTLKPE